MEHNPICPVCASNTWDILGRRTYRKQDKAKQSEYVRHRLDVLFNLWMPSADAVAMSSALCTRCGFVTFDPRPSSEDLDRKYQYLYSLSSVQAEAAGNLGSDTGRSAELFRHTKKYIRNGPSEILDFGGGNGRLLSRFVNAGHRCSIVDYVSTPLPGIAHIGKSIDDVAADRKFDLIICSHVLEHLADPKSVVDKLARHLSPGGVLYVEVPMELWRNVPLPVEPVTHINFFSACSLRALLEYSKLDVLECRDGTFIAPNGDLALASRAMARCSGAGERAGSDIRGNSALVRQLVAPSKLRRLSNAFRFPRYSYRNTRRALRYWAKSNLPFFWRFIP